ncbi:Os03g0851250 [Oryza sativa Japonica Group]|uniref:Os03g0851250 protein n=2 Tax=Oryza sativa subsp. japonica TaxID=39947 RepID=B9F7M5_ORYSJ|nr:hypothetical protein OsJ_13390 [Oryza sativa Japonica Group]BAS87385.1 Os03g0851250 [Oryza sativa Japonica Group]
MDVKLQDAAVAHEDEVTIGAMDAEVAPVDDMMTGGIVDHLAQEDNSADAMEVEQLAQVCVHCGRVHENGLDKIRCARRRPCSRCGLVHREYAQEAAGAKTLKTSCKMHQKIFYTKHERAKKSAYKTSARARAKMT